MPSGLAQLEKSMGKAGRWQSRDGRDSVLHVEWPYRRCETQVPMRGGCLHMGGEKGTQTLELGGSVGWLTL